MAGAMMSTFGTILLCGALLCGFAAAIFAYRANAASGDAGINDAAAFFVCLAAGGCSFVLGSLLKIIVWLK